MNPDLENILYERFPQLKKFTGRPLPIDCDDGWFDLLYDLLNKLNSYNIIITQIKEKFGGLRFYYFVNEKLSDSTYIIIESLVDEAEHRSYKICEICGRFGGRQSNCGWIKTLCEECARNEGYGNGE